MEAYKIKRPLNPKQLKRGEGWLTCPYNKAHEVVNSRIVGHLSKCQLNYEDHRYNSGKLLDKVTCRFNSYHQVYPPELHFHEADCAYANTYPIAYILRMEKDKIEKILGKSANTSSEKQTPPKSDPESGPKADANEEAPLSKEEEEALDLYMNGIMNIDVDEIVWSILEHYDILKAQHVPDEEKVYFADPKFTEGFLPDRTMGKTSSISQVNDPIFHSRRRYFRRRTRNPPPKSEIDPIPAEGAAGEDPDLDSEEWWNKRSDPPFNWFEHQLQYCSEPHFPAVIPQGLTKSQRKKYLEWNAECLKTQLGIFKEEGQEEVQTATVAASASQKSDGDGDVDDEDGWN